MNSGTVSAEEVGKFDRLASRWWDPNGPMKPLHQMNPVRIGWIENPAVRPDPDPGCRMRRRPGRRSSGPAWP